MPFSAQELVNLITNIGIVGVFALLLWKRLSAVTDNWVEHLDLIEGRHRDELNNLQERFHNERRDRERRLEELTEKSIEVTTRLQVTTDGILQMLTKFNEKK